MSSEQKQGSPIINVIAAILGLLTRDPSKADFRKRKAELKLAKKELRVANRMYKQLKKEYEKGGLTEEEQLTLDELAQRLRQRKADLI